MQTTKTKYNHSKPEQVRITWKQKLMQWLRLTSELTVKLYNGYGNTQNSIIYGHVLSLRPLSRKNYRKSLLINLLALIRLFIVRPVEGAVVQLKSGETLITTTTDAGGFFKLEWETETPPVFGLHEVEVDLLNAAGQVIKTGRGSVFIPHLTQYAFISDIDDTFLISHSSSLRKRLLVLFTNNARSRKPFEGVVNHYRLLMNAQTNEAEPNPFFYVSSSEWNLYDYLVEFIRVNKLPEGVFLLNTLKIFSQMMKTGQNNHATKFTRIVRVLEAFPNQKFVLLGDSSQHDPEIYASLAEHFPGKIHAVYIRDIYQPNRGKVAKILAKLEDTGVPFCFFTHSSDAISHSRKIGLIE
jgi:phosphatidate phosphatase APP1